ncbi:MAG: GatB/YqeY domain-containing protein, partial [Mesorhizobium sp.]
LPAQLDDVAITAAAREAIAATGAASQKDMGKVIGALKQKYAGQMDFAKASAIIKGLLQ